jgi:hypothetical protein
MPPILMIAIDVTEIAQKCIEGTPSISKEPVFPDDAG